MSIECRIVQTIEVETLDDVPKGAEIVAVDDVEVVGMCENCGRPILDGEDSERDCEGVEWHTTCPTEATALIEAARAEAADEAIGFTIGYLSSLFPSEEIPPIGDDVRDAWRRAHGK